MDQLKTALALLKKHHFWLLMIFCIIGGMVAWNMAAGSMSAAYLDKKGKIEQAFSGLIAIEGEPNFPNSKWKEGLSKLTAEERTKVKDAWELVYNEQKQLLKWPEFLNQQGKRDFTEKMESLSWGEEIPEGFRASYGNLIDREVPNLLAIVKASDGKAADSAGKLVWSDQERIRKSFRWGRRAPTAMELWVAQEDLWCYATVLTIIAKVNNQPFALPISQIDTLMIGADAADELAKGLEPGKVEGSTQTPAAAPEPAASDPTVAPALDEGRYVDAAGKATAAGSTAALQFKRMPVFMKLKIDQRHISDLLVECANSPLALEVQQVRAKSAAPAAAEKGPKGKADPAAAAAGASFDVELELGGVIYIYNKPDTSKLGGEPATAGG